MLACIVAVEEPLRPHAFQNTAHALQPVSHHDTRRGRQGVSVETTLQRQNARKGEGLPLHRHFLAVRREELWRDRRESLILRGRLLRDSNLTEGLRLLPIGTRA